MQKRRKDGVGKTGMEEEEEEGGCKKKKNRVHHLSLSSCNILKCGLNPAINTNPLVALSHAPGWNAASTRIYLNINVAPCKTASLRVADEGQAWRACALGIGHRIRGGIRR